MDKTERLKALLAKNSLTHYEGIRLPLEIINILPQPRKTFENIVELALDIAKKDLLNPLIVAQFNQTDCEKYLTVINELWGVNFGLKDLKAKTENSQLLFYVLLAGERRLRALKHLWEKGCLECLEKYSNEKPGTCFQRHFKDSQIEVRLCRDIQPLDALFLQLSENTHMAVPAHEEAKAYALLFRLLRKNDAHFPMAKFAREVGRSPKTIKNALRFCNLPLFIQEAVEKGLLAYGVACELARLQENGTKAEELEWWLIRAMTSNYKVDDFRKMITIHLRDKKSGQITLLTIYTEEEEKLSRLNYIQRTVERQTVLTLWSLLKYFSRINLLLQNGLLGQSTSPFALGSPLRILNYLINQLRLTLQHLNGIMPEQVREEAETTTLEIEKQIRRLFKQHTV